MKYTQVASDAFEKLQLNAGMLLTDFTPSTGAYSEADIIGATGGGVSFSATPSFIDFGEDIDNVPADTMELKQIDAFEVVMSGTFKTIDNELGEMLCAAADSSGNKITPRSVLKSTDFQDVWWVGDYSDVTTGAGAGYVAIKVLNALNTGGFSMQSNDKGKGDFAFEFRGHYSLDDTDIVPFEVYVQEGAVGATS